MYHKVNFAVCQTRELPEYWFSNLEIDENRSPISVVLVSHVQMCWYSVLFVLLVT